MQATSPLSMYWIILIGTMLLSWLVQAILNSKFTKYSKIAISSGITGAGSQENASGKQDHQCAGNFNPWRADDHYNL